MIVVEKDDFCFNHRRNGFLADVRVLVDGRVFSSVRSSRGAALEKIQMDARAAGIGAGLVDLIGRL